MNHATGSRSRSTILALVALLLASLAAAPVVRAHPGEEHPSDDHMVGGIGIQVNAPEELAGFIDAVQWGDTGPVDDQTADLVYAGTGCTPASYAPVADQVRGNIAIVDSRQSATNPADQCPAYAFVQKVQSAQAAGAIGLIHLPGEGESPRGNATAVTAEIPALEVVRNERTVALRDAAIEGTANVTLTDTREPLEAMSDLPCVDGMAGPFECDGVDLLSFVPAEEFDGAGQSDLWGWTDPETGDEYVMMGKTNGTAFFRVTDPTAPVYLGALPNPAARQEIWHDIKVYEGHAFIVSESEPHGMTVFDLTRLRDVEEAQEWTADATYRLNSAAHNVVINEDTGFAYIVGGNVGIVVPDQCLSGLHMVDIREPKRPTFAGCYLAEGGPGTAARTVGPEAEAVSPGAYVHDAHCVVYDGPDERYTGRELCFNAAEDSIVIADVTDKANPRTVGVTDYPDVAYAHQGWLTEDHSFLLVNDELDELSRNEAAAEEAGEGEEPPLANTRTIVFDVTDLENPTVHFEHLHDTVSIDHNNYVKDGIVYQSNYTSGLRVLDAAHIADPVNPRLEQLAFFDTYPWHSNPTFDGTWSNYPYFDSGTIAVSGIGEGLFLLRLADGAGGGGGDGGGEAGVDVACADCPVEIRAGETGAATVVVTNTGEVDDTYTLSLDGVPDGWTVTVAEEVPVAAGDSAEVPVTIETQRRDKAGSHGFTLTATSQADPDVHDVAAVDVLIRKGRPS